MDFFFHFKRHGRRYKKTLLWKKSWKDNCDAKNLGRQNAKNFPITATIQYHFSAATYKAK